MKADLTVRYKRSGEGDVQKLSVPFISPSDFPYRVDVERNSDSFALGFVHSMPEPLNERGERRLVVLHEGSAEGAGRTACTLWLSQGVKTGRVYSFMLKVAPKESVEQHMAHVPELLPRLFAQSSTRELRESVRRTINEKFFVETVQDFLDQAGIETKAVPPLPNTATWVGSSKS